ncbi:MAG: hypothetical protein HOP12_08930, partial [Candidatus Eisenbacteria bacterium]|nr:hypothetical protein [Candidatus Eisenbacteria bacterium]
MKRSKQSRSLARVRVPLWGIGVAFVLLLALSGFVFLGGDANRPGQPLSLPNPLARLFPSRERPAEAPRQRPLPVDLAEALRSVPADSLPRVLAEMEGATSGPAAAEIAMTLARLQYVRAEYPGAAQSFTRASARLDPARKTEARYWAGLSWLASGDATRAASILEEVGRQPSPWRGPRSLRWVAPGRFRSTRSGLGRRSWPRSKLHA